MRVVTQFVSETGGAHFLVPPPNIFPYEEAPLVIGRVIRTLNWVTKILTQVIRPLTAGSILVME